MLVIAIGTVTVSAMTHSPDQCIADVQEQKRLETEKRIQELRERRAKEAAEKAAREEAEGGATQTAPKPSNNSGFGGVFAPNTLQNQGEGTSDEGTEDGTSGEGADESSNNSGFGNVFAPQFDWVGQ